MPGEGALAAQESSYNRSGAAQAAFPPTGEGLLGSRSLAGRCNPRAPRPRPAWPSFLGRRTPGSGIRCPPRSLHLRGPDPGSSLGRSSPGLAATSAAAGGGLSGRVAGFPRAGRGRPTLSACPGGGFLGRFAGATGRRGG